MRRGAGGAGGVARARSVVYRRPARRALWRRIARRWRAPNVGSGVDGHCTRAPTRVDNSGSGVPEAEVGIRDLLHPLQSTPVVRLAYGVLSSLPFLDESLRAPVAVA